MPVEIKLEGLPAIEKRIGGMIGRLRNLSSRGVRNELADWEVEDMHRDAPWARRSRPRGTAYTTVRPHSRYEMRRSRAYQRRALRRTLKGSTAPFQMKTSTRPILRQELLDRLAERYVELLSERLRW
jgi:hypothetical protein